MNIKFSKVEGGKAMRTNSAEGYWLRPPEVGKSFVITAESLTPGATMRVIQTSEIVEIEEPEENQYLLTTKTGSKYKIEVITN